MFLDGAKQCGKVKAREYCLEEFPESVWLLKVNPFRSKSVDYSRFHPRGK